MLLVCKLGGEVIEGPRLAEIAAELKRLVDAGHHVVVTHGGGVQATALSKRLGIEPRIVGGRRITDEQTLDVMKMTIAGEVSVNLCSALRAADCRPVGLHSVVEARRRPPRIVSGGGPDPIDFGFVGDVTGFDLGLIRLLVENGYVPVVACLGHRPLSGDVYNINGDIVANQLAIALGVDALMLLTGIPGVMRDISDLSSRIPRLTIAEAEAAIADGTIKGGMIPKIEESIAALKDGVKSIYILDSNLARALAEPGAVGTLLVNE